MREMKDSGIEWIGEIPKLCEIRKLFWLLKNIGSGTTPKGEHYYLNGNIPWLITSDLNDDAIDKVSKYVTSDALRDYSALHVHKAGSVGIAMYGATIGKLGLIELDVTTNQACCMLFPNKSLNRKMLFYILYAAKGYFIYSSYGSGQPNISQYTIKQLRIPYFNMVYQQRIADYLDSKCSKIDSIIERQKQIIEKLKEYKTSLITEVVTKGLDPNVEMKDSGVEWIGKIPRLCEIRKLFWLIKSIGSGTTPKGEHYYLNGDIPWLITSDLSDDVINKVNKSVTADALRDFSALHLHKAGSVGIAMYGATIGKLGLIDLDVTTNQACCVLYPDQNLNRKMLFYTLYAAKNYFIYSSYGSGQPNISQYTIKQLRIPYFNMVYQQRIVDYLDSKCFQIDTSITKKERIVEKLQEYKKSLIYEVVTGKREV